MQSGYGTEKYELLEYLWKIRSITDFTDTSRNFNETWKKEQKSLPVLSCRQIFFQSQTFV